MKQVYDYSSGHIVADFNGKQMLVDTGATSTFYDEYQGVRIHDLSRMIGRPLDGVLGMDSFKGKVLSLGRNVIHLNAEVPDRHGTPLEFISGIPCVDIRINEVPCRAVIKTGSKASYVSDAFISRDKYTRTIYDTHPGIGNFKVRLFVNYFSVCDKNYFTDVGELPGGFELLSSVGADAVIGADLLNRFDMIMDFSENRMHLVSA
ncbi:MAG: hypothetical protein JSW45_12130 [Thiotrichales bacterium]|nr:MAG: hypothetical protein JSW45_12130 [Thiotrichales bacterium]